MRTAASGSRCLKKIQRRFLPSCGMRFEMRMRMKIEGFKKPAGFLAFALLAALMFSLLNSVLCVKSVSGIDQARGLYAQPEGSVDVLFLGSSHVHCNVDSRVLWEEEGIAAYLCTTAEQPLWNSYHYLVEALKTQGPKLVVLDVFSPAHSQEDFQEKWLAENLEGMRFSWNKYEMIRASARSEHLSWLFGYPRYHDRYARLSEKDFQNFFWNREEKARWKGFVELHTHARMTEMDMSRVTGRTPLTPKSQEYLDRIIALTQKEGIPLMLLNAPYLVEEKDQHIYNEIAAQAGEQGLLFLNTNYPSIYREMGLDFQTDFADHAHLNAQGAVKYTGYLGKWMKEHYQLPDRRGQKGYESWEEQRAAYMEE